MTSRILLVRHGRSAHEHDGRWIDAAAATAFERLYDAASIRDDDVPPPSLVAAAKTAEWLVSSDLPRAIASLERLAPHGERVASPLLRELTFQLPVWAPRLPLELWDVLHHGIWTYRLLRRADTPETRRARSAAEWLDARAKSVETTVVVTHGGFRRLLTGGLSTLGWRASFPRRRYANWSVWALRRPR